MSARNRRDEINAMLDTSHSRTKKVRRPQRSAKKRGKHHHHDRARAQIWLSAISYILITVVIIVLLLNTGLPLLEKIKDKSIYSKTKDMFLNIDQQIKDVQSEGAGSQRIIPIEIKKGDMVVQNNQIRWSMESKAKIIEPRTKIFVGDLIVGDDSFITFQDGITYFSEEFASSSLDTDTWRKVDSCSNNDFSINGKFSGDGGCSSFTDNYIVSHKNVTDAADLTMTFKFNTGSSLIGDSVIVGLANGTESLSLAQNNLVHALLFNYSGSQGQVVTHERGLQNWVYNYSASTDYYLRISKTVENWQQHTDFFISTDNEDWTLLRRNTTAVGTEQNLLKPFISVYGGTFTVDDIEVFDNTYHVNNTYLSAELRKGTGSEDSMMYINTSDIIKSMTYTSTNATLDGRNFTFSINNAAQSSYGNGYVTLSELRTDPDAVVLIAHVESTAAGDTYKYDLLMTLEGGVDFLLINVENLQIN